MSTTKSEPLKVGVIGLGWAGQQHLAAYQQIDGVEVVGLAGKETDLLAELGAKHGVQGRFDSWEEMLGLDLDAVSVAVPTFLHAPIAIAALDKGIHVLSEKPIARNGDEARAMVDAARRAGRVLDVAFNHRRRGDIGALKQIITAGELGRPYYAKASWLRRAGIPGLNSWFTSRELAGGGPLADIGVHVLDFALYLLGEPKVLAVSAVTYAELGPRGRGGSGRTAADATVSPFEVEDFASAFLRLEGGATLLIEAGWAGYRSPKDLMDFTVYGTDGGAELRIEGASFTPVGTLSVFTESEGRNADRVVAAEPGRAHQQVVEDFVEVIRSGPAAWARHDGSLALMRAEIIDAAYLSATQNREIQL
ncbi:Predicted dehydrogenase [Nakamurella panacisegetis]|uniref:Predicted dehydrogenase n=1 Tax=Nakamurella panacisegetis TaxID=1090615 RepID=A0A1H0QT05_9ACTN|nr:Gfo/Idh/MocA family oxidoreductase [Nakamurella panacisegetis]SDP20432.1 Predicted dehydrogenase [Nakamurella panacisegetis]